MFNKFTMQGIFALALGSSLAACGAEETGVGDTENVGENAQKLQSFAAPFRDGSTMRGSSADWDPQHGKASCAPGEVVSGISVSPTDHQGRSALCKEGDAAKFTGNVVETMVLADADERRASRLGDWAPGFYKLECGYGEYVSGVSENAAQYQGNNKFHGLQCAQGVGFTEDTACTVRTFDTRDDRGDWTRLEWDYGGYKGECAINEHVAGVSISPSSGGPHSILCCQSSGPAPTMSPGATFWGTGPLMTFTAQTATECYTPCLEDASCTGGTFNPDKQACWLRTGSATVGDGLVSDNAFTVSSSLRDAYYLSLMHAGRTFWGAGGTASPGLRTFSTPSAAVCYQACLVDPSCAGGTFNPDKQACWLRAGQADIGDGLVSDFAFVMPSAQRDEALRFLGEKFAPRLRFDGAANGYPMSAQAFYDKAITQNAGISVNDDAASLSTGAIPTYYQTITCGAQVRLMYWFFYGYQEDCDGSSGSHPGDWERVMVTLSEDRSRIAAVTYWMHGKSYTRLPARGSVAIEDVTHPVIYIGKDSHAAFYNQGGSSNTCLPWEEFRNNSTGVHLDTWNKLVSLDGNEEPWMLHDRQGGFSWGNGGVGTHPTQAGPSCNMAAATWDDAIPTWWHADCEYGDTEALGTCWTSGWDSYTKAWTIGITDRGLIVGN
ncbi:PAN domain-containing protein [Polyangium sp. 15x6]|uniref:PAN domain-containing protein n=1 Tax=Polyangium sp. 15x6 TaxID=3042687 RepID=UPI00249A9781|nr:PAN domain-containing protein [Polyangium sp. 15x6]MDI3288200.1 PAN domain-containing protein [Polyangium sp. 15x6]